MRALVRLAAGDAPDCTRCAGGDVALRRRYGCDGPVALNYLEDTPRVPVFWISCACGGRDPACDCQRGERGQRPMYHCPRRLVEGRPDVVRAFRACQHYPVLPAAGGLQDQTSAYLDVLAVYQSEVAVVERERQEQDERERKRAEAKARRG